MARQAQPQPRQVLYDKADGTGTVEIVTELASIDFRMNALASWARGKDFFDDKKYSRAVFKGSLQSPVNGVPRQLVGELTLHGVTRPLTLTVTSLKCIQHPMLKRDCCGADASGSFNRDDFGLGAGKAYGFKVRRPAHPGRGHRTSLTQEPAPLRSMQEVTGIIQQRHDAAVVV